jgi:hypothetical protein
MSATATQTTTYSVSDIENVMRRFTADFYMIAESTEAMSRDRVSEFCHDLTLMAKEGYLEYVDLILYSLGTKVQASRYVVNTDAGGLQGERPGGNPWPKVLLPTLRVVISHTAKWDTQPIDRKRLKINWSPCASDSHADLKSGGGRNYVSNGYGLERKDYSR